MSRISGSFQSSNDSSLDLSRPRLTVDLYLLPDTTGGFGLWLRPVGVQALAGLLFISLINA
jgi:hypothetical protein